MNILVYGAGVLGSLYAARLRSAGHRVSLLARGRRLADLRRYGLALENAITGRKTFALVDAVERPDPDEAYDLALVPVRKTQLPEVLPALSAGRRIPAFLFMVCNAEGPDAMIRALGRDRVLMGYAGAGGIRTGPLVRYTRVSPLLQRTVIGEVDGRVTPRLKAIRKAEYRRLAEDACGLGLPGRPGLVSRGRRYSSAGRQPGERSPDGPGHP
jgi:2-dehydropantoate 2-reductase